MSDKRHSKLTERIASLCVLSVCVCAGLLLTGLLWVVLRLLLPPTPAFVLAALPGIYYMTWNWKMSGISLFNSYDSDDERDTALDLAMFGPERLERIKQLKTKVRWREYEDSQN